MRPDGENVLRFQIAMDHARRMGMGQGIGDVPQQPDGFRNGQRAIPDESLSKRLAGHIRHHVVEQPVDFTRVDQCQDVRVREARGNPDLNEEACGANPCGDSGLQDLENHFPVVLCLVATKHCGHATCTQSLFNHIPPRECLTEATLQVLVLERGDGTIEQTSAEVRREHPGDFRPQLRIIRAGTIQPSGALGGRLIQRLLEKLGEAFPAPGIRHVSWRRSRRAAHAARHEP